MKKCWLCEEKEIPDDEMFCKECGEKKKKETGMSVKGSTVNISGN